VKGNRRREAKVQAHDPGRAGGDRDPARLIEAGLAHHLAGRLDKAEELYTGALQLDPANANALYLHGTVIFQTGRRDDGIEELGAAIALEPSNPHTHYNLGNALKECGRLGEAIDRYAEALRLKPDFPQALNNCGNALKEQGKLAEAIDSYAQALRLTPDYPEALNNLGNALREQGRLTEAAAAYAEALRLRPDYPQALYNLGNTLQDQDRPDAAIVCYRKALGLKPDYPDACFNLGAALTISGRLDEAYRAFEAAVGLSPRRGLFHRLLVDTGRVAPDSPRVRRMEELLSDREPLPEEDRMQLHFALGAAYADRGRREESFRHLLAGNLLKRSRIAYDEAATLTMFDRIRAVFTAELLGEGPRAGAPPGLPVFVVGMPRSGTTLVEQILASHPEIFGAGELMDLPNLANVLKSEGDEVFPEALAVLPREKLATLAAAYLGGIRARAPSAARVVDKLPDNFLRIGLIRMALPEARIIHVRRDPVDTCLSCFSKLFTSQLHFLYDLAELGRYYRAYEKLMEHWRRVLAPGVMLEVRYEDVVNDLEGQARRLINHCGLSFDARCLAFHRAPRVVRTASAAQVRRPLYRGSVGRWRAFGDLARPLYDALQA